MQTFLPYPNFARSAACLDRQRLGKQRVECLQILRCLAGVRSGWRHHPAVRMWQGYGPELVRYGIAVCNEWLSRGYADTCLQKILNARPPGGSNLPWLGDPAFHASHRAALLAKNPEHYGQFGWSEQPQIKYVWPVKKGA